MTTYTVTVAGSERHDGEAPYTYVLDAESKAEAYARAVAHHIESNDDTDSHVVPEQSFTGAPGENCGYAYNDLR